MAITEQEVAEFIENVEKELQENEAKLNEVQKYLDTHNYQADPEVSKEAQKLLDEKNKQIEFESNQRLAHLRTENNQPTKPTRPRNRGLAI